MRFDLEKCAHLEHNTCATAIVGTWAVLPKDCNRESRSMCQNLFEVGTLFKIEPHWPVPVSQSNPSTPKFLHQRLDNLHNQLCAQNYSDDKFSILAHGRTAFHLSTLEATYIKTSKPNLCKQKEFVYSLKISH